MLVEHNDSVQSKLKKTNGVSGKKSKDVAKDGGMLRVSYRVGAGAVRGYPFCGGGPRD